MCQINVLGQLGLMSFALVHGVQCVIKNSRLSEPLARCKSMSNNFTFMTAGDRITCRQCNAKSKRTGNQCRAPAAKGKTKCRFHGGASTGPKTEQGRQRCAEAKTIHGEETLSIRLERSLAIARLLELEQICLNMSILSGGKTRGRKPKKNI